MARGNIAFSEIKNIVGQLKEEIKDRLTDNEKSFLISFTDGNPIWSSLNIPHVAGLPALKGKVHVKHCKDLQVY